MTPLWPLAVYFFAVLVVVFGMVGISALLGEKHNERATGDPYEGGTYSVGSSHVRFPAKFYLVAMAFVIFDLEAVFIFAWAVSVREVGWTGYLGVVVFLVVLTAGLIYEWGQGILEMSGPTPRRIKR